MYIKNNKKFLIVFEKEKDLRFPFFFGFFFCISLAYWFFQNYPNKMISTIFFSYDINYEFLMHVMDW